MDNLFKTKKNISFKIIEGTQDFFKTIYRSTSEESILNGFQKEIQDHFKLNKISNINTYTNLDILTEISKIFHKVLILGLLNNYTNDKVITFFKELMKYKNKILFTINYINNFISFVKTNKANSFNIHNLFYYNPINSNNRDLFNDKIMNNILKTHYYNDMDEVLFSLDIFNYGDIINLSYPSIGIIKSHYSINQNDYLKYIQAILIENSKDGDKIKKEIPLMSLKIGNKLFSILLNLSDTKLLNNINNINFNDNLKNIIHTMINNIDFNLEEIFIFNKKIKKEYIIPYSFNSKSELEESNKITLERIKDIPSLFYENNNVLAKVLSDINSDHNNIEKKNYKNVMACYLFYIINIVYKICYIYIDKIDFILKNFSVSHNKRFKILNIENAFSYTVLLKKSLLKFKLILLNNFYNLFLPISTNLIKGNYGMFLNENNCYVPSSLFINNNENIINNYPFDFDSINSLLIIKENELIKFLSNIQNKKDIYNKLDLEFGGLAFDVSVQKNSFKILKEFYKEIYKNSNFNLYIIDKVIYNFTKKKCIPYELIDFIYILKPDMIDDKISNDKKNILERKLLSHYNNYIEKASKFYIKYIQIKNKIEIAIKVDTQNLLNQMELNWICYNTFYIMSNCIYIISQKTITNTKFKNSLIRKFNEVKLQYENIIQDYLEK